MAYKSAIRRMGASSALALLTFAVPLAHAHAEVVLAFADGAVTVIRGASLYRANEGTRLAGDDIIETDAGKSAQLEDGAGTLVALGPQTRVLLGAPATTRGAAAMPLRISVLSGWLKVSRAAGTATAASIAMPGLTIEPANGTSWSFVAMAAPQRVAMFAEAGDDTLTLSPPVAGQPPRATLHAGQYAERTAAGPLRVQARVSPEFIAGMPVGFRDALVAVSGRLASRHDLPAALRAVDYADVADWLASDVSARGTFIKRFRPRLKSAEFRAGVDAHLDVLPEWRPVLHPPPPKPLTPPQPKPVTPPAPAHHVAPDAGIHYRDKPTPDDRENAH
jgi:hypothetical protein